MHGTTLWVTDGTASGTTLLAQLDPLSFANLNGTEYFLADNATSQVGLWKTDGTASGTTEVKDLSASAAYGGSDLVASNGKLYFTTTGGSDDVLWASDGTQSGTVIVKDFPFPSSGSHYNDVYIRYLTPFGGKAVFVADDGTHGTQVWVTDGSSGGTQMLTTLNETPSGSSSEPVGADPTSLTVAGDKLYFIAYAPSASTTEGYGRALWVSDGTPGGTSEFYTRRHLLRSRARVLPVSYRISRPWNRTCFFH